MAAIDLKNLPDHLDDLERQFSTALSDARPSAAHAN
jgi:hypothetical protein